MSARDLLLNELRHALRDRPPVPEVPRQYRTMLPPGIDVLERFAERVAEYRAVVRHATIDELATTIAEILGTIPAHRVVVPRDLPREWLREADAQFVSDEPPLSYADLDAVDAVVTGCAVGIAETGTIVLDGGPSQGRRALTLLPDHHICIVRSDRVVGDVPEALARLDPVRPLTWISGPSATSDIELQRVEGVHGPRHLIVVIARL